MEPVTDFIYFGSKTTADTNCSHEIKRLLFLGRKALTNLDSVLKNRDVSLLTNIHIVKTMILPVVMMVREAWCAVVHEVAKADMTE